MTVRELIRELMNYPLDAKVGMPNYAVDRSSAMSKQIPKIDIVQVTGYKLDGSRWTEGCLKEDSTYVSIQWKH